MNTDGLRCGCGQSAEDVVESASHITDPATVPGAPLPGPGPNPEARKAASPAPINISAPTEITVTTTEDRLESPNALQTAFGSFDDADLADRPKRNVPTSGTIPLQF